jgi:hypothetical protein
MHRQKERQTETTETRCVFLIEADSEDSEKLNKKNLIRNQIPLAALEFEDRSPSHDSHCAGRISLE